MENKLNVWENLGTLDHLPRKLGCGAGRLPPDSPWPRHTGRAHTNFVLHTRVCGLGCRCGHPRTTQRRACLIKPHHPPPLLLFTTSSKPFMPRQASSHTRKHRPVYCTPTLSAMYSPAQVPAYSRVPAGGPLEPGLLQSMLDKYSQCSSEQANVRRQN